VGRSAAGVFAVPRAEPFLPAAKRTSREPSPEFALEFAEQYQQMMLSLEDEDLVRLATWKLKGFFNEQIALKLDRSVRSVERKLQLIRKIWIHRQGVDSPSWNRRDACSTIELPLSSLYDAPRRTALFT